MLRPNARLAVARSTCLAMILALGCGSADTARVGVAPRPPASSGVTTTPAAPRQLTLSLVGTNDLHGHVEATPVLGGYLKNLRAARAKDGGGVLLVDAGDMFQGTLESNLGEGVAVLHAYAALGYQAAAVGNHEFDYGPVGPAATPEKPGDDPRGALAALVRGASFPMLDANVATKEGLRPSAVPGARSSVVVEVAGVRVGLVGVTSSDTLQTTIAANVSDLAILPLAETLAREASRLRAEEHADMVVAVAHAGGKCKTFTGDPAADQCEMDSEIFQVARALPPHLVDAIVAGHTHQGVAERVAGIPIIESFSYGKAFGRIDFSVEWADGRARVTNAAMRPPERLCGGEGAPSCADAAYEGAPITPDAKVAAAIAPDVEHAKARRSEPLGVTLVHAVRRDYDSESAEGNLFADLLRRAHPEVGVVLVNGGGLRADLPAGPLLYGALFEAFPFDNKVGTVELSGADLVRIFEHHFARTGGILSVSGLSVTVRCEGGVLSVALEHDKKKVAPKDKLVVLASDFMLTGGDGFWGPVAAPTPKLGAELMRDTLEAELRKLSTIEAADFIDAKRPRLVYPGPRPVKCAK